MFTSGFKDIFRRWDLSEEEGVAILGGSPPSTLKEVLASKHLNENHRLLCSTYERLRSVLQNRRGEALWIRTPAPGLKHKSPLELLLTGATANLEKVHQYLKEISGGGYDRT